MTKKLSNGSERSRSDWDPDCAISRAWAGAHATFLHPISQIRYPYPVHRLIVLADLVWDEIYPAALAMLDGSYWKETFDPGPPDYAGGGGCFEVGGGD